MARKPFSQKQHDQDDGPAKEVVAKYISRRWGMVATENEDQYGVDLLCHKDGKLVGCVEVERRHSWRGVFTFSTVHVPARKRKFFEDQTPSVIFSVRSDLRHAMWTRGQNVLESPVIHIDNKECNDEDFFDVPLDKWQLVNLSKR